MAERCLKGCAASGLSHVFSALVISSAENVRQKGGLDSLLRLSLLRLIDT